MNLFENSNNNKRYYSLDYYYKKKFNCKVSKLCIDAPFTCPNLDGKKGYGGCIYCTPFVNSMSIDEQIVLQKDIINRKWPNSKYIVYLQSHSNTYGDIEKLKSIYEPLLKMENVIGLSVGTRCDCIDSDCLDYLEDLSKRTFLTVELGLQTIHEKTSKLINRCHSLDEFNYIVHELKKRNINVVVHIINGLPFETKEMMIETVRYLNKLKIDGIKIHMLFIDKNSAIKNLKFNYLSRDEYINIVCDQLEELNPDIVVHRLTGDGNRDSLIYPLWSLKKVCVLNDIDKEMARRNTFQGFRKSIQNKVNQLIIKNVKSNDLVIDATIGNGHDSAFILPLIPNGHLYGFDIQEDAIINTKKVLKQTNYTLFNVSHEYMLDTLKLENKISLIIFNLGYLPNSDKKIKTNYNSTIKAIKDSLQLLNNKGIILITVYPGHKEGLEESIKINEFLKDIEHSIYRNTDNPDAPYLIEIKKCI